MPRAGEQGRRSLRPTWHHLCTDVSPPAYTRQSLLWCRGARSPFPPASHFSSHSLSIHTPNSGSGGLPICPLAEHLHRQISKNCICPGATPGAQRPTLYVPRSTLPPKSGRIPWQLYTVRLPAARKCRVRVLLHLVSNLPGTNQVVARDL